MINHSISSTWALVRWRRGHQLFFIQLQLITIALDEVLRHADSGRYDELCRCLDIAAALLEGAAFTFRLAGDFSADDYISVVRPSMEPPATPEGFSGLWSADHAAMIRVIGHVKKILPTLPPMARDAHDRFLDAFSEVYDCHRFVCEVFVDDSPSLLGDVKSTELSGPEQLSALQQTRLRNAGRTDSTPSRTRSASPRTRPASPRTLSGCPFKPNPKSK